LTNADLRFAKLHGANVANARLENARLQGTILATQKESTALLIRSAP
jgi:uncharacterized protein YjbI with pentapeptide repeats